MSAGIENWPAWIGADARARLERRPAWTSYAWALATVALCTGLNLLAFGRVSELNLVLVYLLGLLPVSLRGDRGAAVLAALLSVVTFNFFFTQPYYTLLVDDLNYVFTFFVMGVVGMMISTLTARLSEEVAILQLTKADLIRNSQQLAHANRELRETDRYKDEFLAAVSHELRTPLSAVIGFGSMLAEGDAGPLNSEQQSYVSHLLKGAQALNATVGDLLELSRIQAGKFTLSCSAIEYAPLVQVALEDLKAVAAEKGVRLDVDVSVPGEVVFDGERVIEVIRNLVDNAIKFTPPGGQVTVRARAQGDVVTTEVRDTGRGIPADALPKLFKRFQQVDMSSTRQAGGLGMGLAISKTIVEAHGGQIGVISEPGRGSRFWFSLPRSEGSGGCAAPMPLGQSLSNQDA
ncbi:MAG: histidine kinase [Microvirga sp.]|jgi:K+-sensing histidine kinase KdpD|nr:histidine kinase [Microvirga sp.]